MRLLEEPLSNLAAHARLSIAFVVRSVMAVRPDPAGDGWLLTENAIAEPFHKDYDLLESPTQWAERFDLSRWALLSAWQANRRVGGAVLAFDTPDLHLLESRRDVAVLWDLRVDADRRRQGVGRSLFWAAERWARERRCRTLRVETQDNNVAACRFYEHMGCRLSAVHPDHYADQPGESQLIWQRTLEA